MTDSGRHPHAHGSGPSWFATTHWSMVIAAGGRASPQSRQALEKLCETYWYPLYACVRRRGHPADEAQDLTQEFFARLIEKGWLRTADRQRGRFRSFLLASLKHFLANEWDRLRAQKRGGGRKGVSISSQDAERRYSFELSHKLTAEKLFDRQWALTLLDLVLSELRQRFVDEGRQRIFDRLKDFLGGAAYPDVTYRQVAAELGMTEAAVKMAVMRLRQQYRRILRQHIAETVASPEEIDDEIRYLFVALGTS